MKAKRLMAMLLGVLLICGMFPQAMAESLLPDYAEMAPVDNGHYHDWTGYWVTVEPTCSSYGEKVRQCRECGEREKQIVDKLPHTFGEWEILTEATDHSSGLRQHMCEVCGEVVKESYDPEGTLRPGAHGDRVQRVQQDLVDQGYLDRHSVTRDYDWQTEQGIKEFQKAQGFTPDGIGWPQTLDCLRHEFGEWVVTKEMTDTELGERERTCVKCGFTEKETIGTLLRPGDWHNDRDKVIELQEMLNALGYHVGKADGEYGGKTAEAIKGFQRDHGFPADGILWPGQWDLLQGIHESRQDETYGVIDADDEEPEEEGSEEPDPDAKVSPAVKSAPPKGDEAKEPNKDADANAKLVILLKSSPEKGPFFVTGEKIRYEVWIYNLTDGDMKFSVKGGGSYTLEKKQWRRITKDSFTVPNYDGEFFYERNATYTVLTGDAKGKTGDLHAELSVPYKKGVRSAKVKITAKDPENGTHYTEGEVVRLETVLTNTGSYDMSATKVFNTPEGSFDVVVGEDKFLAAGESSKAYPFDYVITKDDVKNKSVTINASAVCEYPSFDNGKGGYAPSKAKDSVTLPTGSDANAVISIKEISTPKNGRYIPGEQAKFEVILTNTGKQEMTNTTVWCLLKNSGTSWKIDHLAPGESSKPHVCTITIYKEWTESNETAKATAKASCNFADEAVIPVEDSLEIKLGNPAIMVNMTVSSTAPSGFYKRDELVEYVITVSNIGNMEIPRVDVCFETPFGPSKIDQIDHFSTTKTYTNQKLYVSGADVAAGSLTVTARAQGIFETEPSIEASASATVPTGMLPVHVTVEVKEMSTPKDYGYYVPNETINYTVTVRNEGEEAIPQAVISSYLPDTVIWLDTMVGFAPKDVRVYPVSYVVKDSDASAGKVPHMGVADLTLPDDNGMLVDHTLVLKAGFPPSDVPAIKETEFCIRVPETKEDGTETTRIIFCADHSMVKEAESAWETALLLEYGKLEALADEAGKATVKREREAFFTWLETEERESEALCDILKTHCADACNIVHTAKADEIAARLLESARYIPGYEAPAE